jgi:hypothetical protein
MNEERKEINIIKRLLSDEKKITLNNESIEIKELRKLESKFKPKEDSLKNVVVFWRNLIQFSTIGLIDCILEEQTDIIDKTYDFDLFFYRTNEYVDHILFVKTLFKNKFNKNLSEEYIKSVYKNNFVEIIKKSPASSFFYTLLKCVPLYKSVLFCFDHYFNGIDNFVRSIGDRFIKKIELKCAVLDSYKDECDFLVKHGKDYDIFIMERLDKGIEYLEKSEHNGTAFITPYGHNGINDDFFSVLTMLYGNSRYGPYNSEIILFNEGIYVS